MHPPRPDNMTQRNKFIDNCFTIQVTDQNIPVFFALRHTLFSSCSNYLINDIQIFLYEQAKCNFHCTEI